MASFNLPSNVNHPLKGFFEFSMSTSRRCTARPPPCRYPLRSPRARLLASFQDHLRWVKNGKFLIYLCFYWSKPPFKYVYICMYIYIYISVCVCVLIYTCIYIYIYVYVYVRIFNCHVWLLEGTWIILRYPFKKKALRVDIHLGNWIFPSWWLMAA